MAGWQPILVASLISAFSALGALWLKDRLDRRSTFAARRLSAYLRLAAAAEVIAMHSSVYNTLRSPRRALAETLHGTTKFIVVLILSVIPVLRRADGVLLRILTDAIPLPQDLPLPIEGAELLAAMDELIHARVEVHVVGSAAAIVAADQLLDRSRAFLEVVEKENGLIMGLSGKAPVAVEHERERMLEAHREFLDVIRVEEKNLRIRATRRLRAMRRLFATGSHSSDYRVLFSEPVSAGARFIAEAASASPNR